MRCGWRERTRTRVRHNLYGGMSGVNVVVCGCTGFLVELGAHRCPSRPVLLAFSLGERGKSDANSVATELRTFYRMYKHG